MQCCLLTLNVSTGSRQIGSVILWCFEGKAADVMLEETRIFCLAKANSDYFNLMSSARKKIFILLALFGAVFKFYID